MRSLVEKMKPLEKKVLHNIFPKRKKDYILGSLLVNLFVKKRRYGGKDQNQLYLQPFFLSSKALWWMLCCTQKCYTEADIFVMWFKEDKTQTSPGTIENSTENVDRKLT